MVNSRRLGRRNPIGTFRDVPGEGVQWACRQLIAKCDADQERQSKNFRQRNGCAEMTIHAIAVESGKRFALRPTLCCPFVLVLMVAKVLCCLACFLFVVAIARHDSPRGLQW